MSCICPETNWMDGKGHDAGCPLYAPAPAPPVEGPLSKEEYAKIYKKAAPDLSGLEALVWKLMSGLRELQAEIERLRERK